MAGSDRATIGSAISRIYRSTSRSSPSICRGSAPPPTHHTTSPHIFRGLRCRQAGDGRFGLAGFSFGAVVAAATASRLGRMVEFLSMVAPGGLGIPKGRRLNILPVPDEGLETRGGPRGAEAQPGSHDVLRPSHRRCPRGEACRSISSAPASTAAGSAFRIGCSGTSRASDVRYS